MFLLWIARIPANVARSAQDVQLRVWYAVICTKNRRDREGMP
jgi:hypothetical protein